MDCHGRAWRSRDCLYSRAVARSLVSPILAGMDMGGADPLNDRVRLSDYPLVPTIGNIFAPIVLFCLAQCQDALLFGRKGIEELLRVIADPSDKRVPDVVRACLAALGSQLLSLKKQILDFDRMIMAWHRSNQTSKRLNCIPGVGPLLATALVASVADPKTFRSGRNFSAWIGLVPKQYSSGGRDRLGSISKQGDRYLRSLFVAGALAVIRYAKIHGTKYRPWVAALLARRPTKVAAIALANKLARMAWAMMARGERYNYPASLRV